ncbi:matrixin family metalloprotease [Zavarzinella formosa]|uniref:matrixin family metalloprotease n=1 Tax=Zavarzinella formosa TaxID=360055 RepID=UPI000309F6AB|nr:matrixin family metalloprotease [Zavarzinella formosa]
MADTPTPAATPAASLDAIKAYVPALAKWGVMILAAVLTGWLSTRGVVVPPLPPLPVSSPEQIGGPPADVLYYCGRVETLADQFATKPWPVREITWSVDTSGYAGSLTHDQIVEAFDVAWRAWSTHLDISPKFVESPDDALVRSHFADIDGVSRVLAWSELADGAKTPKTQRYDRAERWTIAASPSQAQIDLVRVACHEIGHVLGLVHDDVGTGSLLEPTYSTTVRFPTPRDVQRMIALGYGRRPTASAAPPIPITHAVEPERLAELLRRAGYKVDLIGR